MRLKAAARQKAGRDFVDNAVGKPARDGRSRPLQDSPAIIAWRDSNHLID
jgi:hypothetical protein